MTWLRGALQLANQQIVQTDTLDSSTRKQRFIIISDGGATQGQEPCIGMISKNEGNHNILNIVTVEKFIYHNSKY